jgi:hypothetical protein
MRDDLRFDRYFAVRARGIELPPASLSSVIDRAARRHRHRRAAVSACTAVAVLTAAVSVSSLDGRPTTGQVASRPAGGMLVDSSLSWTVVSPRSGLSSSQSTVVGPGNVIYSLSTAPGVADPERAPDPPVLYRSVDGKEWTVTDLPANLHASSLASTSRSLYAIGTGPAGGNVRAVQLAETSGVGAPWSHATLPLDVGALEARYGVRIGMGRLKVASDDRRVVAAVQLQVIDGLDALLAAKIDPANGYRLTEQGIDVYAKPTMPDKAGLEAMTPDARAGLIRARVEPTILASYTWEQLGIGDELRSLVLGESHVFVADDGHTFREVALPATVRSLGALYATADGFRLFGSTVPFASQVQAWRSADGREWIADALTVDGYLLSSGLRQGRVALVTAVDRASQTQEIVVRMEQPDGSWSEFGAVDLLHRAGIDGDFYQSGTAAVGPLGAAVVMTRAQDDRSAESYLVTSADGIEASVIPLAPLVAEGYPSDVRVTADAITVTIVGERLGPVELVVGTPKR